MLNANDKETLVKSSQTANLLVQDLRDLVKAANPLLAEIAMEILQQAVQIEQIGRGEGRLRTQGQDDQANDDRGERGDSHSGSLTS